MKSHVQIHEKIKNSPKAFVNIQTVGTIRTIPHFSMAKNTTQLDSNYVGDSGVQLC